MDTGKALLETELHSISPSTKLDPILPNFPRCEKSCLGARAPLPLSRLQGQNVEGGSIAGKGREDQEASQKML